MEGLIKDNTKLSNLSVRDVFYLVDEIKRIKLRYRDTLDLPSNVSFGIEIEYEDVNNRKEVDKFINNNYNDWESSDDTTIMDGGEIISPILYDNIDTWKQIKEVCEFLKTQEVTTDKNAGAHVHIGACVLGDDYKAWQNYLKMYIAYEGILSRFVYGEYNTGRKDINLFANSMSTGFYQKLSKINDAKNMADIISVFPSQTRKNYAVNYSNVVFTDLNNNDLLKNTIEFRRANGTINPIIWQNNINAYAKLLLAAKSDNIDKDFLDYKLREEYNGNERSYYDDVYLMEALEFTDMIFDKGIDKTYFLKQYVKDYKF